MLCNMRFVCLCNIFMLYNLHKKLTCSVMMDRLLHELVLLQVVVRDVLHRHMNHDYLVMYHIWITCACCPGGWSALFLLPLGVLLSLPALCLHCPGSLKVHSNHCAKCSCHPCTHAVNACKCKADVHYTVIYHVMNHHLWLYITWHVLWYIPHRRWCIMLCNSL